MKIDQRGKWHRPNTKLTVQDSLTLDISYCKREGMLIPGVSSTLAWSINGREVAAASLVCCPIYDETNDTPVAIQISSPPNRFLPSFEVVGVEATQQFFGGYRLWFTCPGPKCGRRCQKLHMMESSIACRKCQNLTYESSQRSHFEERLHKQLVGQLGCPSDITWPEDLI